MPMAEYVENDPIKRWKVWNGEACARLATVTRQHFVIPSIHLEAQTV